MSAAVDRFTVRSAVDGGSFDVDADTLRRLPRLWEASEEGHRGDVSVADIDGPALKLVVDFCKLPYDDSDMYRVNGEQESFIRHLGSAAALAILEAASKVGMDVLASLTASYLANEIHGRSPDQIRRVLGLDPAHLRKKGSAAAAEVGAAPPHSAPLADAYLALLPQARFQTDAYRRLWQVRVPVAPPIVGAPQSVTAGCEDGSCEHLSASPTLCEYVLRAFDLLGQRDQHSAVLHRAKQLVSRCHLQAFKTALLEAERQQQHDGAVKTMRQRLHWDAYESILLRYLRGTVRSWLLEASHRPDDAPGDSGGLDVLAAVLERYEFLVRLLETLLHDSMVCKRLSRVADSLARSLTYLLTYLLRTGP
eukprot:GHVU01000676.1.p1 GENE.GHVU01000676.1~~GHVU01000676.1.p1  ORF type:complete len:365 (+),score=57.82 GHVU01000676.1:257-1351(+)